MGIMRRPAAGGHGSAILRRFGVLFDDDEGAGGWDGSISDDERHTLGGTAVADPPADEPAAAEPAAEPAAEAATADQQMPPASEGQQPGETEAEWRQRFADENALWQGYRNAESELTRTRQELAEYRRQLEALQQAEEEPELDVDPIAALPLGISDELYNRVVEAAQHDLPGTARYFNDHIEEFRRTYGPGVDEIAKQLMQGWAQKDFAAAMAYRDEKLEERLLSRVRQEQQQILEPVTKAQVDSWVAKAHELAAQKAPDLDEFRGQISQVVQANPQWLAGTYGRPDLMAERVLQIRDLLWAARERERMLAGAQPAPGAPETVPNVPSAAAAPAQTTPTEDRHAKRAQEIYESWDETPVR